MVALSMGANGLVLTTADEAVWAKPPAVQVSNPTGAGDSLLAGVVWALQQGLPLADVARWGVATGTASAMRDGVSVGSPGRGREQSILEDQSRRLRDRTWLLEKAKDGRT